MEHAPKVQVFYEKPKDFNASCYVVAAYVEVEGKILLLKLSDQKEEVNYWGVPAGKLEKEEKSEEGVLRELFEETGIRQKEVQSLGQLYIRKPHLDYIYHGFRILMKEKPSISLSQEHTEYVWLDPEEAKKLPLMNGGKEALQFYLDFLSPSFSFKPVKKSERELVHKWLKEPHVAKWFYGIGLQNTIQHLDEFLKGSSSSDYWLGFDRGHPFAFLITSSIKPEDKLMKWCKEQRAITLDMLIGDVNYLGRGLSDPLIKQFLKQKFSHVEEVLIDPEKTNEKAVHVYQKAGFQILGEFIPSHSPHPHLMMSLNMNQVKE